MNAHLVLAVLAVLAIRAGWLYLFPFGPCPKCKGTGHIKRGPRRRPICPRCKGQRRVQRTGSRTVHRLARKIRHGRQAAARYQQEDSDGTHPDGAHTHGSGGDGLGTAVLVLIGAALAVKLAGPVLGAVAELLHVFLIVAGVVVGVGAASLVGLLTWRWRRTQADAARAMPPLPSKVARAAQPLPQARPARVLPAERQRELPAEVHFHLHGVSAEDVAAIIARRDRPE